MQSGDSRACPRDLTNLKRIVLPTSTRENRLAYLEFQKPLGDVSFVKTNKENVINLSLLGQT